MGAAPSPTAASAWPVPLLLDEVWLRARRVMVHRLEHAGLWPEAAPYQRLMGAQLELGRQLDRTLLLETVGPADHARLHGEAAFLGAGQAFQRRLPLVLAFGASLAAAFARERGARSCAETAQAGALFNLGISLFDLLCDTAPDHFETLTRHCSGERLRALALRPEASDELARVASTVDELEVRVLLHLIAQFHTLLHALPEGHPGGRTTVTDLLMEAFRAEMASVAPPPPAAAAVARRKSTLPFAVLSALAALGAPGPSPAADRTAEEVGQVFWLTDDLVDLVIDAQSGALNGVLAADALGEGEGAGDSGGPPALQRLLEGNALEASADTVLGLLRALGTRGESAPGLSELVLAYVRNWME